MDHNTYSRKCDLDDAHIAFRECNRFLVRCSLWIRRRRIVYKRWILLLPSLYCCKSSISSSCLTYVNGQCVNNEFSWMQNSQGCIGSTAKKNSWSDLFSMWNNAAIIHGIDGTWETRMQEATVIHSYLTNRPVSTCRIGAPRFCSNRRSSGWNSFFLG